MNPFKKQALAFALTDLPGAQCLKLWNVIFKSSAASIPDIVELHTAPGVAAAIVQHSVATHHNKNSQ